MKRLSTLLLALCLPIGAANATLIKIDSPLGPNTIARDTEQGLDWLNLRLTANMSIGEVLAQTELGGRFEGFRYTDFSEFRTLYGPFLACTNVSGFCNNYERMLSFIDAVGGNPEGFAAIYKLGMPDTDPREPRVYMDTAFFELFAEPIPRYQYDSQQLSVPYTYRSASGHFIVRAAQEIPEPATAGLIGIGLLGVAVLRRGYRRRKDGNLVDVQMAGG